MKVFRQSILPFIFGIAVIVASSATAAQTAEDTVVRLHRAIDTVLADPSLKSRKERFDVLAPQMDLAFDFKVMIKTAAGRAWRRAEPATQSNLLTAFRDMSIAAYVNRYADVPSNALKLKGTRTGPRKLILVDTALETPDRNVQLTYVTRDKDKGWRIIDVLLEGKISELGVRRSEYKSILDESGAQGLIRALNDQTRTFLRDE